MLFTFYILLQDETLNVYKKYILKCVHTLLEHLQVKTKNFLNENRDIFYQ